LIYKIKWIRSNCHYQKGDAHCFSTEGLVEEVDQSVIDQFRFSKVFEIVEKAGLAPAKETKKAEGNKSAKDASKEKDAESKEPKKAEEPVETKESTQKKDSETENLSEFLGETADSKAEKTSEKTAQANKNNK
jgi:hypothetical protein